MRFMIRKAQLMVLDETDDRRHIKAIAVRGRNSKLAKLTAQLYQSTREKIRKQIGPIREAYERLVSQRKDDDHHPETSSDTPPRDLSQHDKEWYAAVNNAQSTIHHTLLVDHQACFFEGDAHHVLQALDQEGNPSTDVPSLALTRS